MNEAERLANRFEFEVMHRRTSEPDCIKQEAAAELRRLVAINAELVHALETAIPFLEDATSDYTYNTGKVKGKLKLVRAALEKAKQ